MARSSSAIKIVAWPIYALPLPRAFVDREHDPKDRASRLAVELDDPAVIADNLGNQCKTQAGSVHLGGDERIEQMSPDILGDALPVVLDPDDQRKLQAGVATRDRHADSV